MAAPPGAIVKLAPFDWYSTPDDPEPPGEGDCIVSNGGSAYVILDARQNRNRPDRYTLRCLKLEGASAIPAGTRVIEMTWYPRKRKGPP